MIKTNITEFFQKALELCSRTKLHPIVTILPIEEDTGYCRLRKDGTVEVILTYGSLRDKEIEYNLATFLHELGHVDVYKKRAAFNDPTEILNLFYEGLIIFLLGIATLAILTLISLSSIVGYAMILAIILTIFMLISLKLLTLKTLRSDEYKADNLVVEHGYGEIYLTSEFGREDFLELLSTHPTPKNRRKNLVEKMREIEDETSSTEVD